MSENEKLGFTARARKIIYEAAGPESEWSPYEHRLLDLAQVADGALVDAADALTAAEARIKVLSEALAKAQGALRWYADTCCEHSTCYEGCGKLSDDDCMGCRARALTQETADVGE